MAASGHISRRHFLGMAGAMTTLTLWPSLGMAARGTDSRLLVVLLRGGLDGLHALVPEGDGAYRGLRGALAPQDTLKLDATFALHPALAFAHQLYGQRQLLPLVAVAPPYRDRSHFQAQDCVENGTASPGGASTGWLNRCAGAMRGGQALSVSAVMPLIMRGPADATTWSPPLDEALNPVLLQGLQALYAADPQLAGNFARAVQGAAASPGAQGGTRLAGAMAAAAQFMARADGPRIGFVEDSGWDTHSGQAAILARKLAELDAGLKAFHDTAGPAWGRTAVVVVTEFGRTARTNGTGGTDHGTGGVAFLAGGAVRGGRVAGDWPGLSPAALNDNRDLRATTDMRGLFKGLLATHLGLPEGAIEAQVFPSSAQVRALEGLVA